MKWTKFLSDFRKYRREINQLFGYLLMLGASVVLLLSKLPTFVETFPDWRDVVYKVAIPLVSVLVAVASTIFLYLTPWRKLRRDSTEVEHSLQTTSLAERARIALHASGQPKHIPNQEQFIKEIEQLEQTRKALVAELENPLRLIDEQYCQLTNRLGDEVEALGKRANINLFIGVITTILGLTILSLVAFQDIGLVKHGQTTTQPYSSGAGVITGNPVPVQSATEQKSPAEKESPPELSSLIYHYIPKLSLVIFIELFAFFFLRLYKSNLNEIKYFQNELTNIQCRAMALKSAIKGGNPDLLNDVLKTIAQTERNAILENGQTTVDLEKAKLEIGSYKEVFGKFIDALGKRER